MWPPCTWNLNAPAKPRPRNILFPKVEKNRNLHSEQRHSARERCRGAPETPFVSHSRRTVHIRSSGSICQIGENKPSRKTHTNPGAISCVAGAPATAPPHARRTSIIRFSDDSPFSPFEKHCRCGVRINKIRRNEIQ